MSGRIVQAIFYANPDNYPPIINGARILASEGFELDIFCRDKGEESCISYPKNVRIHRIRNRSFSNSLNEYAKFLQAVFTLASREAQLFIGHDMHGLLPALILAKLHRKPLLYHCHELVVKGPALPFGMNLMREMQYVFARRANLIVVPDADRAEIIKKEFAITADMLVVANAPLKTVAQEGGSLLQALKKGGHEFERVVFRQSSIGPSHAIEATIRSLPLWNDQNWGFVIMGPGEPEYLASLRRLAFEIGVSDRFVILPPVPYDKVLSFTSDAHLGHSLYNSIDLNHSLNSTASNKLMEYLSVGLPVLVSDRPSLKKLVDSYNCGIVADERFPQSIAKAINMMFGDAKLATKMSNSASNAFEQVFCYNRQFAPVVSAINQLINNKQ